MASRNSNDIQAALKKLKDQSNAKEIELLNVISSIYENVKEKKDEAIDKAEDTVIAVSNSVHLYPWRYIGGAALGGLIIGFLCRRK